MTGGRIVAGLAALLMAGASGGCGSDPAAGCQTGPCRGERTVNWVFQSSGADELDVLFVIDDSAPLPPALADGFPRMAQVLQDLPAPATSFPAGPAAPSLHVAFVPASFAGGGSCAPAATRAAACGLSAPAQFLSTAACGRQPNFAGSLEDAFACLSDLGVAACGPPQPFAAIRRALGDAGGGGLPGFSRPGATLQVVIVAARDDASPAGEDAASLAAFLRAAKLDPARVVVSVLGPSAACTADPALAAPAPRLLALVQAVASNGLYQPICASAPETALSLLTTQLAVLRAPPCLGGLRDGDPAQPGVQATCAVEERTTQPDGSVVRAALPSCDAGPPPCWRLDPNPVFCPGAPELALDRDADWCPALPATLSVSCVGCLDPGAPACAGGSASP